jgi:four helix bundle protein
MATIKSFEDMEVWQRARDFANKIYELTIEGSFSRDYSLKDQINKSSGSVMDNIAEGFERGGNKEFILFLSYSKGSVGETRSQLYRAWDRKHISEQTFNNLKEEALLISKMISGFMTYLQSSGMKGSKFHEPRVNYGNHDLELNSKERQPGIMLTTLDNSDLES